MERPYARAEEVSDEALVAGMAAGDERAATAFVRRYQRRVFGLALSMVGDPVLAEDVAQEALLRVWRHAAVFDPRRAPVAAWVLTIARNLAIDAIRLRRAVPVEGEELERLRGADDRSEGALDAAIAGPGLRAALERLTPEHRRALVLAAGYGFTAAEVGRRESIPLGTAKTRIRTAMGKLRVSMAGQDGRDEEGTW
jgi:RNA polymerase sigma-70 factor (ECF subfamily)